MGMRGVCVAIAAALVLGFSEMAGAQTVANSGFEDELLDWEAKFDYGMSRAEPEAARTGSWGLRVTDEDPGKGSGLRSLPIEAVPGQTYEVSFWARRIAGEGNARVSLRFFNDSESLLQKKPPTVTVEDAADWRQFTVKGAAPEEAVGFFILIESVPLEMGTFDLDDFACREVPAAE